MGYLAAVKTREKVWANWHLLRKRADWRFCRGLVFGLVGVLTACSPVASTGAQASDWPAKAVQWFERAEASYRDLDTEDARRSVEQTLAILPDEPKVRLLAGRIALASLDYDSCIAALKGVPGTDAGALRGRAYWYSGKLELAATELSRVLSEPSFRDPWVEGVAYLARNGAGRNPFRQTGDSLAVVSMPRLDHPAFVLPVELNGQPVFGLVSTGRSEVVVDSSTGNSASWVNLRFGGRIEVKDVPALAEDLSGISKVVGVPVKILLGSHLLRHLNVTFDYLGRQFVVRNYLTPAPPLATKVPLSYLNGGRMAIRAAAGTVSEGDHLALLIDSRTSWSLALNGAAWQRLLAYVPKERIVVAKEGTSVASVPEVKLGALSLSNVPTLSGVEFGKKLETDASVELDGLVGSGLLGGFRVSLTDGGRAAWLEEFPLHLLQRGAAAPSRGGASSEAVTGSDVPPSKPSVDGEKAAPSPGSEN